MCSVLEHQGDILLLVDEVMWRRRSACCFSLKKASLLQKRQLIGEQADVLRRGWQGMGGVPPTSPPAQTPVTKVRHRGSSDRPGAYTLLISFSIPAGISASSPLQTSLVRPAGLADFGPSSASSPLSSPLSKGNNVPGTPKSLHLTSSLAPDSLVRKQGKGANPSGGR